MNNDLYQKFITKLKAEKDPEEIKKFLNDLNNFGATELYFAVMSQLTEEDLQAIDGIKDDTVAQEEIKKRFKDRTGITPEDFISQLRARIAQEYLQPSQNQV